MLSITKKELLEKLAGLPEEAEILFNAFHFEESGRKSSIADNLDIEVFENRAKITIAQDNPYFLDDEDEEE